MTDVNVLRDAGGVHSDYHLVVCKVKVKRGWEPARPAGEVREEIEGCRVQGRV